jgi:integrase
MPRKLIKEYGSHGRSVRVFVETFADKRRQDLVRVEWREQGRRRTESLPNSRENQTRAKAFAEGVAERLTLHGTEQRERVTMRTLGERYLLAHPTPETWRPKTRSTFLARWKVWMNFATPTRLIDTVTPETLDEFRAALKSQGYAINQVANHVQMVKSVYRFARGRKYLSENPIADYAMKLSRDQRRLEVPEWTDEECAKILGALDPRSSRHWRAYVAIVLDATLGGRSNALLHLEWSDVDMASREVRWRPELDKLAKDRPQPLPRDAVRALRIARVWRARIGYTGPFIIPGDARRQKKPGDRPYTYQALNQALRSASKRAGVTWIDYRAMHGFRRMVLNNVLAMTGNLTRAGQFIGDTDMRTLTRSYVRVRAEELRDVADGVRVATHARTPKGTPKMKRSPQPNGNATNTLRGNDAKNAR